MNENTSLHLNYLLRLASIQQNIRAKDKGKIL